MKSRKKFLCMDCKVDTGKLNEHYFLSNEVWNKVHKSNKGMLCIGCCESRLGRKLKSNDFTKCTLNGFNHGIKSARLTERLKNVGP